MHDKIDFSQLFALQEGAAKKPLRVAPYDESDLFGSTEIFKCYRLGRKTPPAPVLLRPIDGETPCDFLYGYTLNLVVVSTRVIDTLRREGVTGWDTYPVQIHAEHDHYLRSYHGLVVTGRCGRRAKARSRPGYRMSHTGQSYVVREGYLFDDATWDGSDIFCPEDTSYIFAVRRVKDVLQALGATNVLFQMLETMEL